VSSENKGTTSLLRGASSELRSVANGYHRGPVTPRRILTLTFNLDPGVARDVVVPKIANLIVPRVSAKHKHDYMVAFDADCG
jgi:hypothetical protein